MLRKFTLQLNFTKLLKRANIYKLCLWIIEEHCCLIRVLKPKLVRYGTHAQECKCLLHCAKSLKHNNIYILHL